MKVPPHDLEAEESVLGACLLSRKEIDVLRDLPPRAFYKPANQEVADAILAVADREETVDPITVANELGARGVLEGMGGKPFLASIVSQTPTAGAARHYAGIVEDKARRRWLMDAAYKLDELSQSPEPDERAVARAYEALEALQAPRGPGRPALERFGSGWRARVGDATIEVTHTEEKHGAFWAEVEVRRGRYRVREMRVNLGTVGNASSGRKGLVGKLQGVPFRQSWEVVVDWLSDAVIDAAREPNPIIDLATVVPADPRPATLIHPLLAHRQPNLIFSDGGGGKSTIAAGAALMVATGAVEVPGLSLTKPKGPILYLDWEWDDQPHARRLISLCRGMGLGDPPPRELFWYQEVNRPFLEIAERTHQFVTDHGVALVILDSLRLAVSPMALEDPQAVGPFMQAVRSLQTTSLLCTHVPKASVTNGERATAIGANAWRDACRLAWHLVSNENAEQGTLECSLYRDKANEGPRTQPPIRFQITYVDLLPFSFEEWDGTSVEEGGEGGAEYFDYDKKIAAWLRVHPRSTLREIADGSGVDYETVKTYTWRGRSTRYVQHEKLPGDAGARKWSLRRPR